MSKKIYCILIALLMVLTVSCVSAAEDIDDSIQAVDEEIEVQTAIDDVQLESNDEDVSLESNDDNASLESNDADVLSVGTENPNLSIHPDCDFYGQVSFRATTEKDATGTINVQFSKDGERVVVNLDLTLKDGVVSWGGAGNFLEKGNYNVIAKYSGDSKYAAATVKDDRFNVARNHVNSPNFESVTVTEYGNIIVKATMDNERATGKANIRFTKHDTGQNVIIYGIDIKNKIIEYEWTTLYNKGEYDISLQYIGTDEYFPTIPVTTNVTLDKWIPDISVDTIYEFDTDVLVLNVTHGLNGNINFTLPDAEGKLINVSKNLEDGTASYELISYAKGQYDVNVTYYSGDDNCYATKNIKNLHFFIRSTSSVAISPIANATYNTPVVVNYRVVNRTNNNVTASVYQNGEIITTAVVSIENDTVTVTNLNAGQYVIKITHNGNETISSSIGSAEFNVTKADPDLQVTSKVNEFGSIDINVAADNAVTGNVTFKVINETGDVVSEYTEEIVNGSAKFDVLKTYSGGVYNYTVDFKDDNGNYNDSFIKSETPLVINKQRRPLSVNTTVNEFGHIFVVAKVTKGQRGIVNFLITTAEGKQISVNKTLEDSTASYEVATTLAKGNYDVFVTYYGDDIYYSTFESDDAEFNKTVPVLSIVTVNPTESNLIVNVTADNSTVYGQVNITLFNETDVVANTTVDMVNGVAEYTFTNIAIGKYKVLAEFLGNDDFYKTSVEDVAYVRLNVEMNLTVTVDNGKIVADVNITKGATGTVNFIIRNAAGAVIANLTADINNGAASASTTGSLAKGNYTVEAIYSGDYEYEGINASGNATINKEYLNVTSKVSIVEGTTQATLIFTLSGNATGNVTAFFLNMGTNASYAIENGTVVIDKVFDNGKQSVLLTYVGDEDYYGFDDVYVDVFDQSTSSISVKPVTVVYQNTAKVTVTLTDSNKNPIANAEVIITLNGKNYKGKTNAKGVATISVPAKLVPKAYNAKVSYKGTSAITGKTATFKFTVKKAKAKITAKKKTFKKSKKVKKYTITLKDNKGKAIKNAKVTLKVKGKTYKAKTNSKGKAVFKINKLNKKGTFKAVIKYKGNKYYNKLTKKVKIKVIVTFKTVSRGSKDKATVKEIQQALKDKGYYLTYQGHYLKVDGKFNSCTFRSVKEFQHDKGLKVTGKVDEDTATKLGII